MTEDEICRMYRLSAYPVRQVRILAELTGMDRAEVLRILHARGLALQIDPKSRVETASEYSAGAWEQADWLRRHGYFYETIEEMTGIPVKALKRCRIFAEKAKERKEKK